MKFFRKGYLPKLIIGLILGIQLIAIIVGIIVLTDFFATSGPYVAFAMVGVIFFLDIIVAVTIINNDTPDVYKITWIFVVFVLPAAGLLLYIFLANKQTSRKNWRMLQRYSRPLLRVPASDVDQAKLAQYSESAIGISAYIQKASGGGAHSQTSLKFYPLVDDAFPTILEEMKKAKHYIFLEFFIVSPGKMWDSMLEILEQKAAEGVDVRFIYDDVGSLATAEHHYDETLKSKGIKTLCFNPLRPFLDIRLNNRDHRKILVIDGHTCFSGGFNLADEYINEEVRFGHWKDNAIMLKGKAVTNFTMMFLANWTIYYDRDAQIDKSYYDSSTFIDEIGGYPESDGFIQPYGDLPFDKEAVGETVYLSLLQRANHYVYMTTPYLIIDKEMENAMCKAALRGVDVRLIMPHIPDKNAIFHLSRSFYGKLLKAGVKVYEYTPGFVHEKMFICDDIMATCGTINLDYRSLFLHLECGTFMAGNSAIADMKTDYLDTISLSHQVQLDEWNRWRNKNYYYWQFLRILGPFL